jgi:glycine hydroxymethyltransferase
MLWDLRPHGIKGNEMEAVCDACLITLNKNPIPGDVSAISPSGVRIGTPALTSRGFKEADFICVAELLDRALKITIAVRASSTRAGFASFKAALAENTDVQRLRLDVEHFASKFPMPGFDFRCAH